MRTCFVLVLVATAACGGNAGPGEDPTPDAGEDPPPARGFRIQTPDIEIMPGEEVTYCYYFRTPNTENLAIKHWKSSMTPGSHHMIYFGTASDAGAVGQFERDCGGFGMQGGGTVWTYSAGIPEAEIVLPEDDGSGKPLAQVVNANSAGFFQMHYLNATDAPIQAHVTLDAFALEAAETFTQTAAFITYNSSINIPAGATNEVESMTCSTPPNMKFWLMSTHAHKQATKMTVKDGATEMFSSTDWEHPGAALFMTPPEFYTFQTDRITYECTYDNPTNRTITSGDSAATDEMCMAVGYMFPATRPQLCVNNMGPFSF